MHLVDTDIIYKLAAYNLLKYLPQPHEARVTQEARSPNPRIRTKHSERAMGRAASWVDRARAVKPADVSTLATLIQHGIDPGEATLVASLVDAPNDTYLIWTGDKRCIRRLASTPQLQAFVPALQGRFVVLEQVLGTAIEDGDYLRVRKAVAAEPEADPYIFATVFGSGRALKTEATSALFVRIDELRRDAGGMLSPGPY